MHPTLECLVFFFPPYYFVLFFSILFIFPPHFLIASLAPFCSLSPTWILSILLHSLISMTLAVWRTLRHFFLFMLTSMSYVKTYFFSISYVQLSLTFTLIECLYFLIVYPFSTHTHTLSHRHRSAKSHQLCPTLCNP